ncbi:hypothetical protein FB451DRAFT_1409136 [Mycena latifolia]|nr:hypothetical protein FB451DRAFT_1409136 [Mycena latifolia]
MPPRTKSPLAASSVRPSSPSTNSKSAGTPPSSVAPSRPRRSARFAVAPTQVASTSHIAATRPRRRRDSEERGSDGSPRPLRASRRLSAGVKPLAPADDSTTPTKKRKSPDLHEEGIRKRLRTRCPAEVCLFLHRFPLLFPSFFVVSSWSSWSCARFMARDSLFALLSSLFILLCVLGRRAVVERAESDVVVGGVDASCPSPAAYALTHLVALASPHPTPTATRKGKGKAPSPPDDQPNGNKTRAPTTRAPTTRRVTRQNPNPNPHPASNNPLTLRSTTPGRGASPAPGRLDEIDMGVVRGDLDMGGPLSSPLSSPVRERGDAPWEVKVKVEPKEVKVPADVEVEMGEGQRQEEGGNTDKEKDTDKDRERERERTGDVEMPLAGSSEAEAETLKQKQGTTATGQSQGADTQTRMSPPPPPTPSSRALSPDDFAPSPFAPPAPSSAAILPDAVLEAAFAVDPASMGIAPGPPVSPDWPLPHAPFPLSSSSSSSPSSPLSPPSSPYATSTYLASSAYAAAQAYPAHTRAIEWAALLERRRRAGERALAEAREEEARVRAFERWRARCGWGVPPGRGVRVGWVGDASAQGASAAELDTPCPSPNPGVAEGEATANDVPKEVVAGVEPEAAQEAEVEEYADDECYERAGRRRSPLCIVSVPPEPSTEDEGAQEQEPPAQRTDLVYEAPQVLVPYPSSPPPDDELGPDPHSRMNTGWGPWKIACRVRVYDVHRRYTPALIRSLVAQEADDYFSARGLPHPDALLFMDEEYYDWELEESASEGDGSGEGSGEDDGEGESFELEQPLQVPPQAPVAEPTTDTDTNTNPGGGEGEMDLGTGMGGVLSSFYAPPLHFPGQQLPLPLPPPPLASVRVPVLRHYFTDIPITPAEGAVRGRGTPVDSSRRAAWGGEGTGGEEGDVNGVGRGTLERRQPQPRPRPHPIYLAMARAAEGGGVYGQDQGQSPNGSGSGSGAAECGVAEEDLPPLPRLREPGEPAMLPMRGLRDLVRSLRGGSEEDEGTEKERRERDRREMSEAFEPDEAVWQEFLKSVGVDGAPASASSTVAQDGDAMDVDGREGSAAESGADAGVDEGDEDGGGAGGTSGGVSLGLPPANSPNSSTLSSNPASSSSSSILGAGVGMGVEMGIGMFGMAMGAMGMGWFAPGAPPVAVAVGDGGERDRDRESSLSFALGV